VKRKLIKRKRRPGTSSLTEIQPLHKAYSNAEIYGSKYDHSEPKIEEVDLMDGSQMTQGARSQVTQKEDVVEEEVVESCVDLQSTPPKAASGWNSPEFMERAGALHDSWKKVGLLFDNIVVRPMSNSFTKTLYWTVNSIIKEHGYDPLERLDEFEAGLRSFLGGLSPEYRRKKRYMGWLTSKSNQGVFQLAAMVDEGEAFVQRQRPTAPHNYAKEYGIPERYWVTKHEYAKLNGDPSELLVVEDGEERGRDTNELEAIGWKQTVCIPELEQYL
jgi:hypothetical protein